MEDQPDYSESSFEPLGWLLEEEDEDMPNRRSSADEEIDYRRSAFYGWATATSISSVAAGKEFLYDVPITFMNYYGTEAYFMAADEVIAGTFFAFAAYYSAKKALKVR